MGLVGLSLKPAWAPQQHPALPGGKAVYLDLELLSRPGWSQTLRDLPLTLVLGLKVCTTPSEILFSVIKILSFGLPHPPSPRARLNKINSCKHLTGLLAVTRTAVTITC